MMESDRVSLNDFKVAVADCGSVTISVFPSEELRLLLSVLKLYLSLLWGHTHQEAFLLLMESTSIGHCGPQVFHGTVTNGCCLEC